MAVILFGGGGGGLYSVLYIVSYTLEHANVDRQFGGEGVFWGQGKKPIFAKH
jgi:hypothetical protein